MSACSERTFGAPHGAAGAPTSGDWAADSSGATASEDTSGGARPRAFTAPDEPVDDRDDDNDHLRLSFRDFHRSQSYDAQDAYGTRSPDEYSLSIAESARALADESGGGARSRRQSPTLGFTLPPLHNQTTSRAALEPLASSSAAATASNAAFPVGGGGGMADDAVETQTNSAQNCLSACLRRILDNAAPGMLNMHDAKHRHHTGTRPRRERLHLCD